ncbi:ABC transporter substrate-binding protein [Paenibacillus allorhizosphaerae]|uniref:Extracellular solute-binding protein n=1 Tax=Paenibacillus allorhizosphaerae TaxID=2849866 RepID=A0ABN7TGM5_9BACL|nr:extracellular solute-binding protein [Paenibacillus allorhizosphaerae]CAG7619234.1 hypothetical protein PAECIP111802_00599 [Paenibacillus allorhizosphaerae]
MYKKTAIVLASASLLFTAAACSNGGGAGKPAESQSRDGKKATQSVQTTEPVKLSFYSFGVSLTDADFDYLFVQPLKKKFPNVTLDWIKSGTGAMPEDLVAAGNIPDIVFTPSPRLSNYYKLGIPYDLTEMVKRQATDLNKFDSVVLDNIRQYASKGELLGLPYTVNYAALFYNKDLFDSFGVKYPVDGMDWEQTLDVARKMTGMQNGKQIRGLDPGHLTAVGSALSLSFVDAKTNKALINSDEWRRATRLIEDMYRIPGNEFGKDRDTPNKSRNAFLKDRNIAMYAYWANGMLGLFEEMEQKGEKLNWDMVTLPNFKEALGKNRTANSQLLSISSTGKNKEIAFQVIDYLTSDEAQTILARTGRLPAVSKPEILKSYGADLKSLQGKNASVVLKTKPASFHPTAYDDIVNTILENAIKDVMSGKKDANTAHREAEEQANKEIAAEAARTAK